MATFKKHGRKSVSAKQVERTKSVERDRNRDRKEVRQTTSRRSGY